MSASLYAMMVAGGLNALFVHGSAATARAASSATTMGLGNIVLSFAEDTIAAGGLVLAFFKPVAAAIAALAFVAALVLVSRAAVARARLLAPRRER